MASGGEAVKVAVRVRPFNSREVDRGAQMIIDMVDNQTLITDPNNPGAEPKRFTFDFSYWSFDQFEADSEGLLKPTGPRYADQQLVFNDLGQGVLNNAFEGFNTSLFAYGQTGSGKSYSMVGYGPNKGIVPITCNELFQTISKTEGQNKRYQVTFSMLEVYNEQVRDLLSTKQVKGGLPVRQNTKLGRFYVQGLKRVPVGSYAEIERRIAEGTKNRTLAATKMNETSSRAHTVVTIMFEQISKNESGQETTKSSEINLVDLAGSERAASTGATGDTLKEGSMINKSLSCLGNVISALADKSSGKNKKVIVPYRDSVLTKLLANSLGGNSKTIMIAALSPADINYDETLSTLRYADRAKRIRNQATVNESETDKLIRMLKEENEKLKKALEGGTVVEVQKGMSEDEIAEMKRQMEEEIRAQLEANTQAMPMDSSHWEKMRQAVLSEESSGAEEEQLNVSKQKTVPHFVNLNEDPMLSGVILHFVDKSEVVIGKSDKNQEPDIALSGLSIRRQHALVKMSGADNITIRPGTEAAKTKLNGHNLEGETPLRHMDRVLFGNGHLYIFINPKNTAKAEGTPETVDYDFAQTEIAQAKGFQTFAGGLSKDQMRTQEQVLELLPLLSEVNAISEELNKHRSFEVVLLAGAVMGESNKSTSVKVKMTNLLNNTEWFWSRGKFMDRRFQMQSMYQDWIDSDETATHLLGPPVKDTDPFWDEVEDTMVGTSNVFLQTLGYALDFDSQVAITDYKGEEQGNVHVCVVPCTSTGEELGEDYFVEEPAELLGKPMSFKVTITKVELHSARYSKGLRCKYKVAGQTSTTETQKISGTTNPAFNHTAKFDYEKITPEMLEWFETGSLCIQVFAAQDDKIDKDRLAVSTRQLRAAVTSSSNLADISKRLSTDVSGAMNPEKRAAQRINQQEKLLEVHRTRERRLKELLQEWDAKPADEKQFEPFYRAMYAAVHGGSRFKLTADLVVKMQKAKKKDSNGQKSSACVVQ